MSLPGRDPCGIKCGFCPREVIDVSAIWDEGVAYHEQCFKLYLANELKKYSKKMQLGTLTLAEAKFTQDLQYKLDLTRKRDTPSKNPKFKLVSNSQTLVIPERRTMALKSIQEKERKKLVQARQQRWELEGLPDFKDNKQIKNDGDIKQICEAK